MKKILLFIFVFLISLGILLYSLYKNTPYDYQNGKYNVQIGAYSLSIYKTDGTKQLLKISPFDDFIYHDNTKDHILESSEYQSSEDKTNFLNKLFNGKLLNKKVISWIVRSISGTEVSYTIENATDDEIEITRHVNDSKNSIEAIGQSYVICDECLVTDDKFRIFLTPETLTSEKFELAQSMNLSPLILNNNLLPYDVTKIIIMDKNKNQFMTFATAGHIEVYYYDQWKVLEFKTWSEDKATVSQTIKFD